MEKADADVRRPDSAGIPARSLGRGTAMTTFEVWAPYAQQVEVEIAGERRPLVRQRDGWWSRQVPTAHARADYSYVLDGGEPRPDPRSAWQPYGVHGPSRLV